MRGKTFPINCKRLSRGSSVIWSSETNVTEIVVLCTLSAYIFNTAPWTSAEHRRYKEEWGAIRNFPEERGVSSGRHPVTLEPSCHLCLRLVFWSLVEMSAQGRQLEMGTPYLWAGCLLSAPPSPHSSTPHNPAPWPQRLTLRAALLGNLTLGLLVGFREFLPSDAA